MSEMLKPCPFCGREPLSGNEYAQFYIRCSFCDIEINGWLWNVLKDKWNSREYNRDTCTVMETGWDEIYAMFYLCSHCSNDDILESDSYCGNCGKEIKELKDEM
jgi:hypothetical protein